MRQPVIKLSNLKDTGGRNPHLDSFLDIHYQPKVSHDGSYFNLNIDDRFRFEPPLRFAPFVTTGEPWPYPKKIKQSKDSVVFLNAKTFRILVKDKTCDVLEDGIRRYTKIIAFHTLEEHYQFVFNYNEKTKTFFENQMAKKYKNVSEMKNLEIYMTGEECGYPHVNMNESCK